MDQEFVNALIEDRNQLTSWDCTLVPIMDILPSTISGEWTYPCCGEKWEGDFDTLASNDFKATCPNIKCRFGYDIWFQKVRHQKWPKRSGHYRAKLTKDGRLDSSSWGYGNDYLFSSEKEMMSAVQQGMVVQKVIYKESKLEWSECGRYSIIRNILASLGHSDLNDYKRFPNDYWKGRGFGDNEIQYLKDNHLMERYKEEVLKYQVYVTAMMRSSFEEIASRMNEASNGMHHAGMALNLNW